MVTVTRKEANLARDLISWLGRITPLVIVLFSTSVMITGIIGLIVADPLLGVVGISPMTTSTLQSALVSFAETGLNLATIGFFIWALKGKHWLIAAVVAVPLAIFNVIDIGFDAMSADVMRYGQYVSVNDLPVADRIPLHSFRILLGGMSTLGDFLAIYALMAFESVRKLMAQAIEKLLN